MIKTGLSPEHHATVERLQKLSDLVKHKVVGSALAAAARPVKDAMRALSPVRSGRLRDAVGQQRLTASAARRIEVFDDDSALDQPGTIGIRVAPLRKVDGKMRGRISHLLELGVKPHRIKPKSPRGMLKLRGGLFAKSVMHPGIRATYYMARSLDQAGSQIEERFFEGMSKRLDKLT